MKLKNLLALTSLIIFSLLVSPVSYADIVPITVDRVEIDDIRITQNEVNRLSIERGKKYPIEIELRATEDVENVEIEVFIVGFEFNDFERQGVIIPVFDADKGVRYVKKAMIEFSDDVGEDDYLLRIFIADRNHESKVLEFRIKLDVPRHGLQIEDVTFFPGTKVTAGSALLANVRLENKGEEDEEDVKVTISIPDLGLEASDFIDEIEFDDEEETEEIFLTLPKCTEAGIYPVQVEVLFNEGREKFAKAYAIEVLENPVCAEQKSATPVEVVVAPPKPEVKAPGILRTALEIILLALVGLLVLIGIIIGFAKLKKEDEF